MDARQLSLFKGKRQRGVRPPTPREFLTHVALADLLRRWCPVEWLWTHFPAGEDRGHVWIKGERRSPAAEKLKRMGLRPGFPDFQFFHIKGDCLFLELKRQRGGRQSDDQERVTAHLQRAGHRVHLAYTLDDAVAQ